MLNFNDVTKTFEEASKVANANNEALVKLFDLNLATSQKLLALNNEVFSQGLALNASNVSKFASLKSPKDLETLAVDLGKQVEKLSTETTSKVAAIYQGYSSDLSKVVTETVKTTNEAAKKVAVVK